MRSRPLWARGLKCRLLANDSNGFSVAPLVGAGIEISLWVYPHIPQLVAPLVGAGIEIIENVGEESDSKSRPLWARGLK